MEPSQLKGDAWWNGTAAWWLAAREGSPVVDLTGLFARSEFLTNAVTHAITGFEIAFAVGIWFTTTQQAVARIGLVAWPLIGVLADEPLWGIVMAVYAAAKVGQASRGASFSLPNRPHSQAEACATGPW